MIPSRVATRLLGSALDRAARSVPGPAGVALKLLRPMSLLTPTALAFGAGLLVGSGVTLLTAPRSGAENRAALRRLVRRALRRDKSEALLPAAPQPLDAAD